MLPTLILAGGFIPGTSTSAQMNLSPKRKPNYDEGKDER